MIDFGFNTKESALLLSIHQADIQHKANNCSANLEFLNQLN